MKTKRSPLERRFCPDTKRVHHSDTFTHGLVRSTAKMLRAKQKERKAEGESERRRRMYNKATKGFADFGKAASLAFTGAMPRGEGAP